MYTGRRVPAGITGESVDHTNTPHPIKGEQEPRKKEKRISIAPMNGVSLALPFILPSILEKKVLILDLSTPRSLTFPWPFRLPEGRLIVL
jgi:hypothetical protein